MANFSTWESTLTAWSQRCRRNLNAHYRAAELLAFRHRLVGGSLLVLAAVAAAFSGAIALGIEDRWSGLATAFLTGATLAVASLHVFLQDNDRALQHRKAGGRYSSIKREIELLAAQLGQQGTVPARELQRIRRELDIVGEESIAIPKSVWKYITSSGDRRGLIPTEGAEVFKPAPEAEPTPTPPNSP